MQSSSTPFVVILSGPSGVGKDAVLTRMRQLGRPYHYAVTATTRKMRANEVDGVDYIFVSVDVFRHMVDEGQMLEHAEVYGNLYGVPRAQVAEALERGLDVMVEIDVQGAATLRRVVPDAVFIFMAAPSMNRLERRLQRRKTESPEALRVRLETARSEISQAPRFDYIVINADDRIDDTVRDIESVMERERQIKGDGNAGT